MKYLLLFLLFTKTSFCQQGKFIKGRILDSQSNGVPYASVYNNGFYGCISDSMGYFKLWANPNDSILISSIGFESFGFKAEKYFDKSFFVLKNKTFLLDSLIILPSKNVKHIVPISKRLKNMQYVYNYNFEEGVLVYDNNLENKYLESITIVLGFKGNPVIPFRINVYSLNMKGIPDHILNTKMVSIEPTEQMKKYKVDFTEQNIKLPKNGFCISIELLNNSINHKKLGKNYTPKIGFVNKTSNIRIIRTDYLPNWGIFKSGNMTLGFGIEVLETKN